MTITKREQQSLIDIIARDLHIIADLNNCEEEDEHKSQAVSAFIIDMSLLLQKINKADVVEEEKEWLF